MTATPRRSATPIGSTAAPRVIRLRRPAVVLVAPGRFVPAGIALDEVDEAWALAASRNPRLFDGALLHVQGVSRNGAGGVTIHAIESSYRFHAVRAVGIETGVRPLGVKAITRRDGRVLLGRRSPSVHAEPGAWEFVPGGTLSPGVDPAEQVARELGEECGWECATPPWQMALLFDDHCRTWEIVHGLEGRPAPSAPSGGAAPSWEYDRLDEVAPAEVARRPLTHASSLMRSLLAAAPGAETR